MQTSDLGLTGKWTYVGPEFIWVFVDKSTNKLDLGKNYIAHDPKDADSQKIAELFAGQAYRAVLVDPKQEPCLASVYMPQPMASELPQKEYKLDGDDTVYYSRPDPQFPDHTYELSEIQYDFVTNSWVKPFPWKQPHVTIEQMDNAIQVIVASAEADLADEDTTDEMKSKLETFVTEMKNVKTKFAGWQPWQIPFPNDPRTNPEPIETPE
jgi:hypothetical protein